MTPLLHDLKDGERSNRETLEALASFFRMTEEDLATPLPSGRAPLFANRIAWAKVHLKGAGMIESPRRGIYRLTARGHEVLTTGPASIDLRFLRQFPEYQEFRATKKEDAPGSGSEESGSREDSREDLTPEEHIDYGYEKLREGLAIELLRRIKSAPAAFFERLVVELLLALGYGGSRQDAGKVVGGSGDGGIDGVINEDRLGLDVIYVQAKRWKETVSRPEIQKFAGALQGQRAKKGVFITTSSFSREAEDYAERIDAKIVLIDGSRLVQLMIDHDIGVATVDTYAVKRIDSDYFEEA